MARNRLKQVVDHIAATFRESAGSDSELLERFVRHRDESAFEALVRRHGGMVLGVCRRVLGHAQDAEDAFQATFLVLSRKAATLRQRGKVANWLFGVAHRTALEARDARSRRRLKEAAMPNRVETSEKPDNDIRAVLDDELARLPNKYREVIVLRDIEGQSGKQVAAQLGCPEGTVKSRLNRAHALLAKRLARHGFVGVAGALAVERVGTAAVPVTLIQSTAKAATLYAAGTAAAVGAVTVQVAALTEGVLKTMLMLKLKVIMAVLLVAGVLGTGGGWFYYQATAAEPNEAQPQEKKRPEPENQKVQMALLTARLETAMLENRLLKEELAVSKRQNEELIKALAAAKISAPEVREEVLYQGKPKAFWLNQFKDRDQQFRQKAIIALVAIGVVDATLLPFFVEVFNDDVSLSQVACVALGNIGKKGVPLLLRAIKEHKGPVRSYAAFALEHIGPDAKAAVPSLIELLKSPDAGECNAAATALGAIRSLEAVSPLIDVLQNEKRRKVTPSPYVGRGFGSIIPAATAAIALGSIGPGAKDAVPALKDALKIGVLREQAAEALKRIDPSFQLDPNRKLQ